MNLQRTQFGHAGRSPGCRQAARLRLALPGKVILITGHQPCLLDDLSQTGASLTVTALAPPVGGGAVLLVDGVEAFGSVVWRRGHSFAISFDEPLPLDDLVRLRTINDHFQTLEQEQQRRDAREFVQGRRV